jgi:hypothetical protein
MSKGHQASRRRTYGRRLHELHERTDQNVGVLGWIEEEDNAEMGGARWSGSGWPVEPAARAAFGQWLNLRGID